MGTLVAHYTQEGTLANHSISETVSILNLSEILGTVTKVFLHFEPLNSYFFVVLRSLNDCLLVFLVTIRLLLYVDLIIFESFKILFWLFLPHFSFNVICSWLLFL